MTRFVLYPALVLAMLSAPLCAEQEPEEGFSLMEEGAKMILRGLMTEMEPALEELEGLAREMEPAMRSFVTEMGPAMKDLLEQVEDWTLYHPPEILPNGDIILRRRPEAEIVPPEEIDL
ncbi:MAG: hypothetical protein JXQ89_10400 [Pelagimonas sp.]